MENTKIGILSVNLSKLRIRRVSNIRTVLLFSCLFGLSGCANNAAKNETTKAGKHHYYCILEQAQSFREKNSNQDSYPLFTVAYKHCSPQRNDLNNKMILQLEHSFLEKNNMDSVPAWVTKQHEQAILKFENEIKNKSYELFKKEYQKEV